MCVHHVFSSHSSVDGDLGWFHTWTIVNSAAMKAFVHVSLWCASPGVLVSTQVFYLQADSHSDRTLCAHQQCTWAALPLIPAFAVTFSAISIQSCVRISSCFDLHVPKDAEWLLGIGWPFVFPLYESCLFESLAYLLIE